MTPTKTAAPPVRVTDLADAAIPRVCALSRAVNGQFTLLNAQELCIAQVLAALHMKRAMFTAWLENPLILNGMRLARRLRNRRGSIGRKGIRG
jgi:hypothetical protein